MRIHTLYPSPALMSRVLATPKEAAEQQQTGPRFAEAMDSALAAQMAAASAMAPVRPRLPVRAPEKKDPRDRRQKDDRETDEHDERPQDQRRNGAHWA